MLNQIVMVGRIVESLELKEVEGKKVCNTKLAVQRSYKNEEGIYEVDFIPVTLTGGIAENISEYCKKGDLVGVKGSLTIVDEKLEIKIDKVTCLSSQKEAA